jgi:hypothetical protein
MVREAIRRGEQAMAEPKGLFFYLLYVCGYDKEGFIVLIWKIK